MIAIQERVSQRGIFYAIRRLVQELHPDKVFLEDVNGAPFLFKSQDALVWVRVFYRPMQDFSLAALKGEIEKLWVLMPKDAVLYFFYPSLNREQILKMNGMSDRLNFFEYGYFSDPATYKTDIRICKWVPAMAAASLPPSETKKSFQMAGVTSGFSPCVRLTLQEINDLNELGLTLKRA